MSNENKAGALILSQIGMLNEAIAMLNTVESKLLESIDTVIKDFTDENGWIGNFDLSKNGSWLAPSEWKLTEPEDGLHPNAWFDVDIINNDDDDDYWTALFCEQGISGGEAGFMFNIEYKFFGGKTAWNNFAKTIDQSMISKLLNLGFKNQGKGIFFLPIHLDANLLASTWEENGEFTHDDDCFDPLRQALEKIKAAQEIFSQILNKASGNKQKPIKQTT